MKVMLGRAKNRPKSAKSDVVPALKPRENKSRGCKAGTTSLLLVDLALQHHSPTSLLEVAVGLLRRGVHLGIIDSDQNTALHLAIVNGHADCAVALVDLGYVEETHAADGRTSTLGEPGPRARCAREASRVS